MRIRTCGDWVGTGVVFIAAAMATLPCAGADEAGGSARAGRPAAARVAARTFPSVFQAWNGVENVADVNRIEAVAKHDLAWNCIHLCGLQWDTEPVGLAEHFTKESIETARAVRRQLLALNPNMVLIAEIRYRDTWSQWLPEDHPWWLHSPDGRRVKGWEEGGFWCLDFTNPDFRTHVAARAKAAIDSGVADGILLDWWRDDEDRLALVREVRRALGDEPLIIVNTNDRTAPRTAPYVNGLFMECYRSATPEHWRAIAETLTWAEQNLRRPRVNCVELWYHRSRQDLDLMRAATTLALTHSDGYCLFSDPNPLPVPDHRHDWYRFWDKGLGKSLSPGVTRDDGAVMREFEKGTVVYNPMGNRSIEVAFGEPRISRATGKTARTHTLPACDGDIYLKPNSP